METIIISLGGSLIVPDDIDTDFLKDFKALVLSQVARGKKFVLITGGGKTCRKYQDAFRKISTPSLEDLDWLGIYSTHLNAEFVRLIFGEEYVEKERIINPNLPIHLTKSIAIGAGWKPGSSTDLDAVLIAKTVGAKKLINLSNIDYVYDKDPKKNPDAKKIEEISWADYRKLIPEEWNYSGLSSPFDPTASKIAEMEEMQVIIMNGKSLDNLVKCLNGEKFLGTVIS